jgi:hypothetical protein
VSANTIFEDAVEKIFDVTKRFAAALEAASIPYRVVGGLAVFVHVDARDPLAARLTKDVDVAIHRENLNAIRGALEPYGFIFRQVAGVDMFFGRERPQGSRCSSFALRWRAHKIR